MRKNRVIPQLLALSVVLIFLSGLGFGYVLFERLDQAETVGNTLATVAAMFLGVGSLLGNTWYYIGPEPKKKNVKDY